MRMYIWLVVVLAFSTTACNDEPISLSIASDVSGIIFEVVNEEKVPLVGVRVSLNQGSRLEFTDSTGLFLFEDLEAGSYILSASKDSFNTRTLTSPIEIQGEDVSDIELELIRSSVVLNAPDAPKLAFPADQSTDIGVDVTLRWHPVEESGVTYSLSLFHSVSLEEELLATSIIDTFFHIKNLSYGTSYLWIVKAKNEEGEASAAPFRFSTAAFPDYPIHFVRRDSVEGSWAIYAAEAPPPGQAGDTLDEIRLTAPTRSCWRPHMSPDNSLIAFLSTNNVGQYHLFVMNRNGSEIRQVSPDHLPLEFKPFELNYSWTPDGSQLVYPSNDRLVRVSRDGSAPKVMAQAMEGFLFTDVQWSAQNDSIIVKQRSPNNLGPSRMSFINEQGQETALVRDSELNSNGQFYSPTLSLDGSYLYFSLDEMDKPNPDGSPKNAFIQFLNLSNGFSNAYCKEDDANCVKNGDTNDLNPVPSPGGDRLLIVNKEKLSDEPGNIELLSGINGPLDGIERTTLFVGAEMPDWR